MSPEDEAQIGKDAHPKILKAYGGIYEDEKLGAYIAGVTMRIARASDLPDIPYTVSVLDSPVVNAFALPGGKVGVNTGLFKVAKDDNQLATVMAHEVGHAIARHGSERMSQQMAVQAGLAGLGIAGGQAAQYAELAAAAATLGVILPFSRTQEAEADHIGVVMMAKAGYDPRASVTLWENFAKLGGPRQPEFLSTHPAPTSRIENLKALMPEAMAIYKKSPKAPTS